MTDPIQSPRLLDLTPSTPAQVTAALACLARHNATDLTDALGLTTTSPDTTTTGRRHGEIQRRISNHGSIYGSRIA